MAIVARVVLRAAAFVGKNTIETCSSMFAREALTLVDIVGAVAALVATGAIAVVAVEGVVAVATVLARRTGTLVDLAVADLSLPATIAITGKAHRGSGKTWAARSVFTTSGGWRSPQASAAPIDEGIASPHVAAVLNTVVLGVAVAHAAVIFLARTIRRVAAVLQNAIISASMIGAAHMVMDAPYRNCCRRFGLRIHRRPLLVGWIAQCHKPSSRPRDRHLG